MDRSFLNRRIVHAYCPVCMQWHRHELPKSLDAYDDVNYTVDFPCNNMVSRPGGSCPVQMYFKGDLMSIIVQSPCARAFGYYEEEVFELSSLQEGQCMGATFYYGFLQNITRGNLIECKECPNNRNCVLDFRRSMVREHLDFPIAFGLCFDDSIVKFQADLTEAAREAREQILSNRCENQKLLLEEKQERVQALWWAICHNKDTYLYSENGHDYIAPVTKDKGILESLRLHCNHNYQVCGTMRELKVDKSLDDDMYLYCTENYRITPLRCAKCGYEIDKYDFVDSSSPRHSFTELLTYSHLLAMWGNCN